jgi:WD40 repeat protein
MSTGWIMGRPERAVDPDKGPVERFAVELRRLRDATGRPGYRELARRAHYSVATLAEAAGGKVFPSLQVTLAYVEACGGDRQAWAARWREVAEELSAANPIEKEDLAAAPYRGLATFGPADAEWFFGRRRLVDQLMERLSRVSFMAVFGPSGSGKSSLLRAGMLPALERGAIPGSADWPVLLFTPGDHPVEALATALATVIKASARSIREDLRAEPRCVRLMLRQASPVKTRMPGVVLVVDQFEEVFTLCRDAAERACFIDCLLAAADGDAGRDDAACRVVLGMRADFYARCAEYPALVTALYDRQLLVGTMSDDELREVVTGPAAHAGLKTERALVEVIVADAHGEPGALPLVSHTLLETWRRRKTDVLTLAAYRGAGGIQGGIAQTAERVFAGLAPEEQRIAHQVFLRLTALGEGTEDTRRRVPMTELLSGPDSTAVTTVLERLSAARLLTLGDHEVQVAHEAIIRHWPRLRGWLADDRELLRAHRRLTEAAVEWDQHGKDEGLLYRGARLAAWDHHNLERLNSLERTFLSVSRRRQVHEHGARRRRIRLAATGLLAALTAMSVLAATALVQAVRATDERDLAITWQLIASARSQLPTDPVEAIRLARRAYEIKATSQVEDMLRQATLEAGLSRTVGPPGHAVTGLAFSPDGRWLVVQDEQLIAMYDLTRKEVAGRRVLGHIDGGARPPVFHPSGRYLAAVDGFGTINVWDLSRPPSVAPLRFGKTYDKAWSIAVSADGRWLYSAGSDGTVRAWDWAARGNKSAVLGRFPGRALTVAVSKDGRHVAAGGSEGTTRIWDRARSGRPPVILSGHESSVETVGFSSDGRRLASGDEDGTIRIWPVTGGGTSRALHGHIDAVESVAFSPDGRRLASGGRDGTVQVWDATDAGATAAPLVLGDALGEVSTVAFAPDGGSVAGGGAEGITRLWDVRGSGDPVVLRGHAGPVWDATASQDGRKIASAGEDGTVRVWNSDGTGKAIVLAGHAGRMFGVAFSPDGDRVAAVGENGTIRIWNADGTGEPITLRGGPQGVQGLTFTRDGRQVVTLSFSSLFRWNAFRNNSGPVLEPIIPNTFSNPASDFTEPTPSAPPMTSWRARVTSRMIRLFNNEPGMWRQHRGLGIVLVIGADGQPIARQGKDVRDIMLANPAELRHPVMLQGHQGRVRSVAVRADGWLVATTAADHTVRIWRSTGDGEPLVFRDHGISAENIDFMAGGRLLTTYDDGTIRIWRCDVCGPIKDVLRLADQRVRDDQ